MKKNTFSLFVLSFFLLSILITPSGVFAEDLSPLDPAEVIETENALIPEAEDVPGTENVPEAEDISKAEAVSETADIPKAEAVPVPEFSEELLAESSEDKDREPSPAADLSYATHVQTYGWLDPVTGGKESGTTGQAKRMEAIHITLENQEYSGSVQYCTHIQTYGWQDWRENGALSGTEGKAKRLEAIRIRLTGEMQEHYDIWYQTHIQHFGWSGWASNGEPCGSEGYAFRLEAVRILLSEKGAPAPGNTVGIFYRKGSVPVDGPSAYDNTLLRYSTHVQTYGWQPFAFDGALSGTTGESKRLEGIRINLGDSVKGSVRYRTHVQSYGWQDWRQNGAIAGTAGEAKRLEAIQIELTGEASETYDIYYRVHSQTFGWLAWTKNGQKAGTEGMHKRLEAIEIVLVPVNQSMPGYDPAKAFKKAIPGSSVTWIGDSYSSIYRHVIESKLPGADMQVHGSKFISFYGTGAGGVPGIQLADSLKKSGRLRRNVVFALGTNSADGFTRKELDQVRSLFGDSYKVVFVTPRTNVSQYASGNAMLRDFVKRYPNYYLYDWAATGYRPSYMAGDGIHPTSYGINFWIDGIIDTLNATA